MQSSSCSLMKITQMWLLKIAKVWLKHCKQTPFMKHSLHQSKIQSISVTGDMLRATSEIQQHKPLYGLTICYWMLFLQLQNASGQYWETGVPRIWDPCDTTNLQFRRSFWEVGTASEYHLLEHVYRSLCEAVRRSVKLPYISQSHTLSNLVPPKHAL